MGDGEDAGAGEGVTKGTEGEVLRYHPLLVGLHWVIALMAAASLMGGLTMLQATPNGDPMKQVYLQGHMLGGMVLGALMIVRLVTRLSTAKPGPAGGRAQHLVAQGVHWAIYLLLFAMVATGLGMAALAGLWPILGGGTVVLPADFAALPPHGGHELFARVLIGLILLHVLAAVWHGVAGEGIWGRMWFGRRRP
jgi:cytochrome b561